jgi:hypothetical protein
MKAKEFLLKLTEPTEENYYKGAKPVEWFHWQLFYNGDFDVDCGKLSNEMFTQTNRIVTLRILLFKAEWHRIENIVKKDRKEKYYRNIINELYLRLNKTLRQWEIDYPVVFDFSNYRIEYKSLCKDPMAVPELFNYVNKCLANIERRYR